MDPSEESPGKTGMLMVWQMFQLSINSMSLVKVRGSSMREKKPAPRTQEQIVSLAENLVFILGRSLCFIFEFLN